MERDNLFINFDPANMILYGSGEPIEALEESRPLRAQRPLQGRQVGGTARARNGAPKCRWARATSAWRRTCARSTKIGYTGPLTIEREIPQDPQRQKEEIGHAVRLLTELKAKLGAG